MSENKLIELVNELLNKKDQFEDAYTELMDAVNDIEDFMNDAEELYVASENLQERLNVALNKQNLVSQLREQLESSVSVEEPTTEVVNENDEQEEQVEEATELTRSQLGESQGVSPASINLVEFLRSQLNTQEDSSAENDIEEDNHEDESDDLEEENWDKASLHPLVQSLRQQITEAELRELPEFTGDEPTLPADTSNIPNLSDVLRQQLESSAPIVEAEEDTQTDESSLSLAEMIQQMRIDINTASEVENKEEEEELISAAASNSEVAASLRQQLLVQELKKQLK